MMEKKWTKFKNLLDSATRNLSQAFFDQYVEINAGFRSKAGLKTIIVRKELGDCCKWCKGLSGSYLYDTAPKDVYERHVNCKCIVTIRTEKGKWQDAWSKIEYKSYKDNRKAREIEILEERANVHVLEGIGSDVTMEYLAQSTPGIGTISRDPGFIEKKHEEELDFAIWLKKTLGGEIIHNADSKTKGKN